MHPAFNIDLRLELHIKLDFASKFIDPESIKSSQRFLRGTLPPPSLGSAIARVFQLHGFQKGTHGAEWGLNPVLFCVWSEGQGRGGGTHSPAYLQHSLFSSTAATPFENIDS